jgi:hypothetical protein
MKVWLGVIGRACLEFAIILILISFAAGASIAISAPASDTNAVLRGAAKAALDLVPLAGVFTLFLAFFSFELRVKGRAAGWLGLLLLGVILMSFGLGIRRLPLIRGAVATSSGGGAKVLRLIPAATAEQQDRVALWVGSFAGGEALNAVAVDFSSDYPRLAYSARAPIDFSTGDVDIQGRAYRATLPDALPLALVPEASIFSGYWIWDRLDSMDDAPLFNVFAAAGGFLLLAIGFRFLCRITGWPLANALLAAAGLGGLVALDALLSGGAILGTIEAFARRIGLSLPAPVLLACVEGIIGLALGAMELTATSRRRRRAGE